MTHRTVQTSYQSQEQQLRPSFSNYNIGYSNLGKALDPFVNLDDFAMNRPIFRAHPHAGFSAVTYIFEDSPGSFINRWSYGEPQLIDPGDLHWTQAGSGMIHEEVPTQSGINCHGLQMFVRLPTAMELSPPEAFHLNSRDIPEHKASGVRARILVGSAFGKLAPINIINKLTLLDVHLDAGASIEIPAAATENAFAFVISGSAATTDLVLAAHAAATFAQDGSSILLTGETACEVLVGFGSALNEPYISEGPFMLSTPERLNEATERMRSGGMGHLAASF
jgi:redox-sensitive bicupin YhaK (pirin superfamily)